MKRGSVSIAVLVIAATFASRPAFAQDSDTERVRTLFDDAGELERQGQWPAAQEKLRAAIRIRETPHLHYALGWALENDDKLLEAKVEYELAARLAASRTSAEEVTRLVAVRLAEVEKKTPFVQVRVPGGAQSGARVIVDGRATALVNDAVAVPVNPGTRVIRVERPGRAPSEQLVYVPRGMVRVVDVPATDAVASRTGEEDRHDASAAAGKGSRDRAAANTGHRVHTDIPLLPVVLAAGGAILFISGAAVFVSSSSDASDRDDNMRRWCDATACTNGTTATLPESTEAAQYRQAANDASSRGNTKQILGATLGGLGLVSAAAGAYLLFRNRDDRPSDEHAPTARTARTARAVPVVAPLPGGAMAGATLEF